MGARFPDVRAITEASRPERSSRLQWRLSARARPICDSSSWTSEIMSSIRRPISARRSTFETLGLAVWSRSNSTRRPSTAGRLAPGSYSGRMGGESEATRGRRQYWGTGAEKNANFVLALTYCLPDEKKGLASFAKPLKSLVGERGFEPPAPTSRTKGLQAETHRIPGVCVAESYGTRRELTGGTTPVTTPAMISDLSRRGPETAVGQIALSLFNGGLIVGNLHGASPDLRFEMPDFDWPVHHLIARDSRVSGCPRQARCA